MKIRIMFLFTVLLGTSVCLLPSCKDVGVPPDRNGSDTTSHNFIWRIDTLGEGNSVLNDVYILDGNNIWAVGEIYLKDTSGQLDPQAYNAAKWDGARWNLMRVPTKVFGTNSFVYGPLCAIFAFGPNEIAVTTGGQVIWFNGQTWAGWTFLFTDLNDTTFGGINKFWGTSKSSLWGVGDKGNIFHYNGSVWQKQGSGTNCRLTDIWGSGNTISSCGWNFDNSESVLLKKTSSLWEIVSKKTTPDFTKAYTGLLSSTWTYDGNQFWIVGSGGVFRHYPQDGRSEKDGLMLSNFPYRVRGNGNNDVSLVGDASMIWHWNGASWHKYDEIYNQNFRLYGLAVNSSQIVAVGRRYGSSSGSALIISGKR